MQQFDERSSLRTVRLGQVALVLLFAAGCAAGPRHALVPVPAEVRVMERDSFTVDSTATIAVDAGGVEAVRIAGFLAEAVGTTPESRPPVVGPGEAATFRLVIDAAATDELGPEGYRVRVDAAGVRIEAASSAGLFYGVQTVRQLLPPVAEYDAARPGPLALPHVEIVDRPRFRWRGAMLDVARHFFGVDDVKRYIDLLALHKLNRLHLHLADDQGWRIQVPGWPALTEIGASTEVGGGPGGFYTTEDYRALVEYAAARYITIVPEIDLPGHTNAALASVPDINCDGVAPPVYTGIEVGFSTVCVDRQATYDFVDAVIGHLATVTPGPWIHVGGDEVEELTDEEYRDFIEAVEAIVHRHGKVMVGWQEVAAAELQPSTLVQLWHGTAEELATLAPPGQVILSPAAHVYLDMKYHDGTPIGLDWAGLSTLRDAYEWDPASFVPGLSAGAVVGLEAALWTETLGTMEDLEFMALPRLAAAAELAWSPVGAIDWGSFRQRVARLGLRWTAMGINYYRSPDVDWPVW
jgi:hexosaminidase